MKKIKVLHIISDTNIGGAGKLLYNLYECLDKSKFEFEIVIPENSRLIGLFDKKIKIYEINGLFDKSFDINSVFKICKVIKVSNPDIIHTHSSLSGRIAAKICRIPTSHIVYTKHCTFDLTDKRKNIIYRKIYNLFDKFTSGKIIAVAKAAKNELIRKGIDKEKIEVIINGSLPLKKYKKEDIQLLKAKLNIGKNDFVIGIVARLEKYKDHVTLINAAKLAKRNNDNFKFLIIGNGSMISSLKSYVKKLKLEKTVIFLGFQQNISKYMNLLDINVNCSIGTETSNLSISEGFSLGIPAIASNFGGNINMVKNSITGYIFPMKQYKELYNIIKSMYNSKLIMNKMRENAFEDYEKRFSAKNMTMKYEELYYKILKQ